MKNGKKSYFFDDAAESISMLGEGYIRYFKKFFQFVFGVVRLIVLRVVIVPYSLLIYAKKLILSPVSTLYYEGKKFFAEVKRAVPTISRNFREKPSLGISSFFRYVGRAFKVHEKFTRAVLSTVIPIIAVAGIVSFALSMQSVTFALSVTVNGQYVGTVEDENAYKQAQTQAEQRFLQLGEQLEIALPEYTVALTLKGNIDGTETVCNNIISAVCENTVSACGIYADGEFICAVKSEDTFNRVSAEILSAYAEEYGYTSEYCTVTFNENITTVIGLYPQNEKIWTAEQLKDYLNGWSAEKIEHTVAEGEDINSILEKYNITQDELLSLNKDLNTSYIPEGSTLLVSQGERNVSIKVTVTYTAVETSDYNTVIQYDNNFYVGTSMTIVEGKQGIDVVSYTDTYVDGVLVDSASELVRYNANAPVNELVKIGTLGVPVGDDDSPVSPRLLRDQGGTFIWPAPDNCFWLSQAYNPSKGHYGIDIVSSDNGSCKGRPIVSVADGVVVLATYHWSWGYYVRVDHGDGVVTGYAHALKDSFKVNVGDYVRAGQQLSSIGTTGNSTGYHLHFEVWLDGTRVNPLPYVYSQYTGVSVGR